MTNTEPTRALLADDKIAAAAREKMASFHKGFVIDVVAAVAAEHIVVVGMAQNPFVGRAHRALKKAGIAYKALDHGSYFSGYHARLAVKLWSGYPTFPQVFVDGMLIGGCSDLEALIAAGTLR